MELTNTYIATKEVEKMKENNFVVFIPVWNNGEVNEWLEEEPLEFFFATQTECEDFLRKHNGITSVISNGVSSIKTLYIWNEEECRLEQWEELSKLTFWGGARPEKIKTVNGIQWCGDYCEYIYVSRRYGDNVDMEYGCNNDMWWEEEEDYDSDSNYYDDDDDIF